ncbi:hypothetical protein GCM10023321_14150 [Pseudonocardia eucalypti]|uniref:NACHT domain-containing protein n=1 Tax=Pseudonocardia eucalypti TaxID=648755 RepID=A0ABP9PQ69_9PSEU
MVALGWWLWVLYRAPNRADLAGYWQLVVAIPSLAVAVGALVRDRAGRGSGDRERDAAAELRWLADRLAEALEQQWTQAAVARRLVVPEPIAVRWARPARAVAGSAAAATLAGRFAPLPGLSAIRVERFGGGGVRELHGIYGGLGSGRLVIVGAPGAGKSGAAILLVLDALRHRGQVAEAERDRVPVPVLVTLQQWSPRTQSLRAWLAGQLCGAYPGLLSGRGGERDAAALIESGRIAVIADGLDEIAEQLRPLVLRALSSQATFRLVLLARSEEMLGAAEQAVLDGAVAVELRDVGPAEAVDYLARVQRDPPPPRWRELLERVSSEPDGALARALSTPLILSLVRDTCRDDAAVGALLDLRAARGAALTRVDVENHLLGLVLPEAYAERPGEPAPPYPLPLARRTLGWLAARMNRAGTRDLAWWRIPAWTSPLPGVVLVGVAAAVSVGLGLLWLPAEQSPVGWLAKAILGAVAVGGAFGAWLARRRMGRASVVASPARGSALSEPAAQFVLGLVLGLLVVRGQWALGHASATPGRGLLADLLLALLYAGVCYLAQSFFMRRGLRRHQHKHGVALPIPWRRLRRMNLFSAMPGFCGAIGTELPPAWALVLVLLFAALTSRGVIRGLARAIPRSAAALTPLGQWRYFRIHSLLSWPMIGIFVGGFGLPRLEFGILGLFGDDLSALPPVLVAGLALGLALAAGVFQGWATPPSWLTAVAAVQLTLRHRTPPDLMHFLDDAHQRGVLRAVGLIYQFRHARLQDRLATHDH